MCVGSRNTYMEGVQLPVFSAVKVRKYVSCENPQLCQPITLLLTVPDMTFISKIIPSEMLKCENICR